MREMEPDRCLAMVVKIIQIDPIPGADAIELAHVLGWQVIIKKGEFQVGDLAIYFSIGAVLPVENPHFAFLKGKELKTRKILNTLSQGLLGPLSWVLSDFPNRGNLQEDDDLTQLLQIKKAVRKEELSVYTSNGRKATFPSLIPKTDEERIQNASKKMKNFLNKPVVITQKYDGTSTTFMVFNQKFTICGRNHVLLVKNIETHHYFEIAQRYELESKMLNLNRNIAIQGETIGQREEGKHKINGNRHHIDHLEFYVFNIYDIDKRYYMKWDDILEITTILGLKTVPVVYQGPMKEEWLQTQALVDLASQQRYDGGHICEGIVIKTDEGFGFPRYSFKAISNDYLLKYKL